MLTVRGYILTRNLQDDVVLFIPIPSKTTIYVAQTEWIMKQPRVMQITSRILNWIDNNFLVDDTCESDTK